MHLPNLDSRDISAILSYRYLPGDLDLGRFATDIQEDDIIGDRQNLVEEAAKALLETVQKIVDDYDSDTTHVVPLSGGLDSRNILCALLSVVERDRVVTLTFGSPNTLDWNLGAATARTVGVEHHHIDARPESFPWSRERLLKEAEVCGWPSKLFRNVETIEGGAEKHNLLDNTLFWHGYMGGVISGGQLPKKKSENWERACEIFIGNNYKFSSLTEPGYSPYEHLPDTPMLSQNVLSYDEQLEMGLRQRYYTGTDVRNNSRWVAPFTKNPICKFMLNLPRNYRSKDPIYPDIARQFIPEIANVPQQAKWGLTDDASEYRVKARHARDIVTRKLYGAIGKEKMSKDTRHFDWDIELRRSNTLQGIVEPALVSLSQRDIVPWLAVEDLYRKHQNGANKGSEIQMLTSLELFYQAAGYSRHTR